MVSCFIPKTFCASNEYLYLLRITILVFRSNVISKREVTVIISHHQLSKFNLADSLWKWYIRKMLLFNPKNNHMYVFSGTQSAFLHTFTPNVFWGKILTYPGYTKEPKCNCFVAASYWYETAKTNHRSLMKFNMNGTAAYTTCARNFVKDIRRNPPSCIITQTWTNKLILTFWGKEAAVFPHSHNAMFESGGQY